MALMLIIVDGFLVVITVTLIWKPWKIGEIGTRPPLIFSESEARYKDFWRGRGSIQGVKEPCTALL